MMDKLEIIFNKRIFNNRYSINYMEMVLKELAWTCKDKLGKLSELFGQGIKRV